MGLEIYSRSVLPLLLQSDKYRRFPQQSPHNKNVCGTLRPTDARQTSRVCAAEVCVPPPRAQCNVTSLGRPPAMETLSRGRYSDPHFTRDD